MPAPTGPEEIEVKVATEKPAATPECQVARHSPLLRREAPLLSFRAMEPVMFSRDSKKGMKKRHR